MAFQSRQWARAASWVGAGLVLVACATEASPTPPEGTGRVSSAVFTNGGFTVGAVGAVPPAPWVLTDYLNPYSPGPGVGGVTIQTPQTLAGLNLESAPFAACATNNCEGGNAGVCTAGTCQPASKTVTLQGTGVFDATLGMAGGLTYCRYNNRCAIVNQLGDKTNVNQLSQTMTIGAGDVDPTDGQVHVRFVVAPVLENPAHLPNEQPYFYIQLTDLTQNTVVYSNFNFSNQAGVPWQTLTILGETYDYTDWQLVDIHPGATALNMGDQVQLLLIAAGCSLGGHFGELYVDGVGVTVPGLYVSGTAPSEVNPCTAPTLDPLTYTLTYKNGSAAAETGVAVTFNTPTNTTFASVNAPGLTCTTPAVGAAGAVKCTVGNLAAGASGSFTITVDLTCGTTGSIVAGNYSVASTQETALLGNTITTRIGCALDAQCPAADWCDEATADCTPKLANSQPIPKDPTHTNPTLNGTCTVAAGALVCVSGVCDTVNNECGYGTGEGPCTAANGGVVCQSGVCSTNLLCMPAGGCNVDADCKGGDWCDEATNTCTPKLANGQPMPTDPKHTSPTLGGTCTAAGATLVCVSGVCDSNGNVCGIKLGDGTCTATPECITGVCITTGANSGKCELCGSDANCAVPTPACDQTTNTCVQCTATNTTACIGNTPVCGATDTCVACNGDNGSSATSSCPTTGNPYCAATGACTKCTSDSMCTTGTHPGPYCDTATGACTTACQTDAECGAGNWCNSFSGPGMCEPKLPNGQGVPGQPCTPTLGSRACIAGVCDTTDNLCGYADGDGPCGGDAGIGSTVCRSGICATMGTNAGLCEACSVNSDCPTGQVCSANNTCVVAGVDAGADAGPVDAGVDAAPGVDSGTVDSGSGGSDAGASDSSMSADAEPGEDAAADGSEDATSSAADASNSGIVEGGGCSSAGAPTTRGGLPAGGLLVSLVVVLAARRRRARRQESPASQAS